jgi:hypothetical protein
MREFELIMIAFVTTLSGGLADADEPERMVVVVVTAMRPGTIEAPERIDLALRDEVNSQF